ncbi:hypothetical protein SAMN05216554_4576 [Herbiconiux ginsengi]|uniref:PASTA domain-containing protein n=1 Tax=Herbiconiux ginsengi TaxID=381665 RepID=A0A1H3TY60_9MICO|nr:hypothetical protein SAMN05216554_4576 [Herbiconiux ginsengi]
MVVPNVVGLPFHIGRDVASKASVALANPDPDGPPIGSLAWPGLYYIVRQNPAPGTVLYEWDSVAVEVVKHGDSPDPAPAIPRPAPPTNTAHATPEREGYVDLTDK